MSTNIFAALDLSDGEEEVPKVNKKATATETESKNKQAKVTNKTQTQTKPRESKPETVDKAATASEDVKERKDDNRGGRPRGKEGFKRGENQHGNVENDKPRRPKREFERRSGTGRGKEVSRGGRGPYGFGNVEQEAHDAEKDPAKAEVAAVTENVDDTAEPEPESAEITPEVEETPTLSFDDFIKQREEARASSSLLSAPKQVRSVNVETQFAGLTTKADEDEETSKQEKNSAAKKDQRSTTRTQVLDVQFKFETPNYQRNTGRRENNREFNKGGRFGGKTRKPRDAPTPLSSGDFPSL